MMNPVIVVFFFPKALYNNSVYVSVSLAFLSWFGIIRYLSI